MKIECWFDGSARPTNPGRILGFGGKVEVNGKEVWSFGDSEEFMEKQSSNVAEYIALRRVLKYLISTSSNLLDRITVYGDSKLAIEQMSGRWKIKRGQYKEIALECRELLCKFRFIEFQWIPREQNGDCDVLSKTERYEQTL